MNCIIIDKITQGPSESIWLNPRQSKHVKDVLGKKAGDTILAGMMDGPIGMAPIIEVTSDGVRIGIPNGRIPPVAPVDLILAMPRPKVMKRLWAPLASIGLRHITIIAAERVEPCYFDSHAVVPDVYEPLLIEGLEQARDTRIPNVKIVKSFTWFAEKHLSIKETDAIKILGQPGADTSVRSAVFSPTKSTRIVLAVGPEGGWTPDEMDAFSAKGFIPVGMRDRALRTDTAIVSLLALVYDALGDIHH